jgi:hypothetical protein
MAAVANFRSIRFASSASDRSQKCCSSAALEIFAETGRPEASIVNMTALPSSATTGSMKVAVVI